jgi:glycosyltransferase involved in cell wall biosynthesis
MKPDVSIIIPCRNEAETIELLLEALYTQKFPRERLEVIIADGISEDSTRQKIAAYQAKHPDLTIKVVDNPKRIIPAALNRAIEASTGDYVIRLDAHSIPREDYIACSVQGLENNLAENVGGVWDIAPQNDTAMAKAIAAAAGHPLAVGGAKYRFADKAEYVETVPFGAWRRNTLQALGGYDETLLTNEDYELNTRLSQQGGRIYLDPQIRSLYFARQDLPSLAKQYWRYGYWKAQMLKRYPGSLKLRQALPPLLVAGLALLLVLAIAFKTLVPLFLLTLGLYLLILIGIGVQIALQKKDIIMIPLVAAATAVMHFSWGSGFLIGMAKKH